MRIYDDILWKCCERRLHDLHEVLNVIGFVRNLSYFEPKNPSFAVNYGYDKWGVAVVVFKPTGTNKSENSFPVAMQAQIPQEKKQLHGISHDIFIRNE